MNPRAALLEAVQARVVRWASTDDEVRALMLFGSRASDTRTPDEWSDLDFLLVVRRPDRLRRSRDWLATLGRPLLACTEPIERTGHVLWRVLLDGGLDVDISVVGATEFRAVIWYLAFEARAPRLASLVSRHVTDRLRQGAHALADTIERGRRFLVDKDGCEGPLDVALRDVAAPGERSPTPDEFRELVSAFWQHALRAAKHLVRGHLYAAWERVDVVLKAPLRTMIQWHAGATRGWAIEFAHWRRHIDSWSATIDLERCADSRVVPALQQAFARYDADDVRRALWATTDLFSLLARETANALQYDYPSEGEQYALGRLRVICGRQAADAATAGEGDQRAAASRAPFPPTSCPEPRQDAPR